MRVVWDDTAKGKSDVIIRTSGYELGSFVSIKNLSNNDGDLFVPKIMSSEDNIYVMAR